MFFVFLQHWQMVSEQPGRRRSDPTCLCSVQKDIKARGRHSQGQRLCFLFHSSHSNWSQIALLHSTVSNNSYLPSYWRNVLAYDKMISSVHLRLKGIGNKNCSEICHSYHNNIWNYRIFTIQYEKAKVNIPMSIILWAAEVRVNF